MRRLVAPGIVLLIALARGIVFAPPPFVDWTHDDVYFVSLALARHDPDLFARDVLFQAYRPAFPAPYIALLDGVIATLGSPEAALRWIPAVLLAIYLLGVFSLARCLTGSTTAGIVAALILSRPWPTTFLVSMGIQPGRLFARDLSTALLPALLAMAARVAAAGAPGASRAPARNAFFIAGLLAVIHPISAPQVLALVVAMAIATGGGVRGATGLRQGGARPAARDIAEAAALFALGAFPYFVALARLPDLSLPSLDLVRFRMPYALPPRGLDVVRFLLVQALPLAAVGGAGIAAGRLAPRARRGLIAVIGCAAAIAGLGAATSAIPALLPFEPIRAAQYVYLPLAIGAGALAARAVASRRAPAIASALLAAFALTEPSRMFDALSRAGNRLGIGGPPANFFLQTDGETMRTVAAASCIDRGGGREAFLELARFARERTAPADLFLIPPVGLDHFRVHARRGVYVSWKDGGVILFSRRYAEEWDRRFRRAVTIYASGDGTQIGRILASGEAQYAVYDARRPRLDLPVVFENSRFVVHGSATVP